jgi:hypothetical protein
MGLLNSLINYEVQILYICVCMYICVCVCVHTHQNLVTLKLCNSKFHDILNFSLN